jgi:hypothetical protein
MATARAAVEDRRDAPVARGALDLRNGALRVRPFLLRVGVFGISLDRSVGHLRLSNRFVK